MEKQKLEAHAREAEQHQELRMFEHQAKMEVIHQAHGRDAEIRASTKQNSSKDKGETTWKQEDYSK